MTSAPRLVEVLNAGAQTLRVGTNDWIKVIKLPLVDDKEDVRKMGARLEAGCDREACRNQSAS